MPYKNQKHKTRNQRQHRRAGHVRRIEVVLSAESERDHAIADFLDDLPRGEMAEFIRQAIVEKMERGAAPELDSPPEPRASDQIEMLFVELDTQRREASQQIETLYQELADEKRRAGKQLEAMVAELVELKQVIRQPLEAASASHSVPDPPHSLPEVPVPVASSGIDMSRPRPKKAGPAQRAPQVTPAEPEVLSEEDQIRLAKIMAASIRNAQPGRGDRRT